MKMLDEELITLREMAKHLDRSYQLVHQMVSKGHRGVSGEMVKLECVYTQSGMKTSLPAYRRFLERMNDPMYRPDSGTTNRTPASQESTGGDG